MEMVTWNSQLVLLLKVFMISSCFRNKILYEHNKQVALMYHENKQPSCVSAGKIRWTEPILFPLRLSCEAFQDLYMILFSFN